MDPNPTRLETPCYFPPEPVTWVGEGPSSGVICLGFESGRTQFADPDLTTFTDPSPVYGSGEAINGAVFHRDLIAVSNRHELNLLVKSDGKFQGARQEGGAYGIVAGAGGSVIASRGFEGLLLIQRGEDEQYACTNHRVTGAEPCFYQTIFLGQDESGQEWFASACRTDGLALLSVGADRSPGEVLLLRPVDSAALPPQDIVSLCPLNLPGHPFALGLLTLDGSVWLSRDARSGDFISTSVVTDDPRSGTPYSIQSAQGHIFVLTSEKLYAIQDLARQLTLPDVLQFCLPVFCLAVDAVDCSIIQNESLMIIEADRVTAHRVSQFFKPSRGDEPDRLQAIGSLDEPFVRQTRRFNPQVLDFVPASV